VKIIKTKDLSDEQKQGIIRIWNAEYPVQIQHSGIETFDEYLSKIGNPEHYLLTNDSEKIKGWVACFLRDDEKWFAMLVDTSEQKKGFGSRLLREVKKFETEINGWAIDGSKDLKADGRIYFSPIEFYRKNDFEIINDVRLEDGIISAVKIKWTKVNTEMHAE